MDRIFSDGGRRGRSEFQIKGSVEERDRGGQALGVHLGSSEDSSCTG